jgi:FtsP/CotA-like multicopper oxidase with cupredoxin domain
MRIFILFILLHLNFYDAKFVNYVEKPKMKDIYKFDLVITHGMSMSVRNDMHVTWDPAMFDSKSGEFISNIDKNNNFNCKYDTKVTNITKKESIITAAGLHRELFLINDQFPGPSIVVPLNSKVEITVHNHMLTSVTSLHWHGLIQKNTFYHDGVGHLTQCPIGPMESYTYKFKADNLGTHWYHSHSGKQK